MPLKTRNGTVDNKIEIMVYILKYCSSVVLPEFVLLLIGNYVYVLKGDYANLSLFCLRAHVRWDSVIGFH